MELRINKIQMADKNWLSALGANIAEGGEYELKLLFVASDGLHDQIPHVQLKPFNIKIDSGVHAFGKYGYTVYRNPKDIIPPWLDCHFTLLEDDSGIRDTAALMDAAIQIPAYKSLLDVVAGVVSAPYQPLVMVGDALFNIMLSVLSGNKDDNFMQQDFSFLQRAHEFDKPFSLENEKLKADFTFV